MGTSFHNLDWNSLEEVSNNLGHNGTVGTPTTHSVSSSDDFVTAAMLELVKRQLEEVQTEQIRTVKVALGTEREERTVNDSRLKTCIEKLMTEMVRLNAQFKGMQQRIGEIEKWKNSPPTAAVDQQIEEMPQNGMPVLSPEQPFPPNNSSEEGASTERQMKVEGSGQDLQTASPSFVSPPAITLEVTRSSNPMTTDTGSPGPLHQRADPLPQHRPFQLCNVGRILSSGSFQSQLLGGNGVEMEISSHPDPALPVSGDHVSNPIVSSSTASPSPVSNLTQASSKSGAFLTHEMASTPGRFLPYLCICGLEFDSYSGLSKHVMNQDMHKENVPTSQSSISTQIDSSPGPPKTTSLRQEIIGQKDPTSSKLEPVGEQALVHSVEMPSTSTSTSASATPSAQFKIGKLARHGDGQAHEKDPIRPKFCICGEEFRNISSLDYHIRYFSQEKNVACGICERKFVFPAHLRYHMKRDHQPGKQSSKRGRKPRSFPKSDVAESNEGAGNGNTIPKASSHPQKESGMTSDTTQRHGKHPSRPLHCLCRKKCSNSLALYQHIRYFTKSKQSRLLVRKSKIIVNLKKEMPVPPVEMGPSSSSSSPPTGESGSQDQEHCPGKQNLDDSLAKLFGCEFCPMKYRFRSHLWGHLKSKHKTDNSHLNENGKMIACSACGELVANFKLLAAHRKAMHN